MLSQKSHSESIFSLNPLKVRVTIWLMSSLAFCIFTQVHVHVEWLEAKGELRCLVDQRKKQNFHKSSFLHESKYSRGIKVLKLCRVWFRLANYKECNILFITLRGTMMAEMFSYMNQSTQAQLVFGFILIYSLVSVRARSQWNRQIKLWSYIL